MKTKFNITKKVLPVYNLLGYNNKTWHPSWFVHGSRSCRGREHFRVLRDISLPARTVIIYGTRGGLMTSRLHNPRGGQNKIHSLRWRNARGISTRQILSHYSGLSQHLVTSPLVTHDTRLASCVNAGQIHRRVAKS